MNPREFIESLANPISRNMLGPKATVDDARIGEIDGWLWAEGLWPEWGPGGVAFVKRARLAAEARKFEDWHRGLPALLKKESAHA